MKISAIDIRKHTFEKIFRGYDPDEVDAFLNSLSQEWERFSSENGLLKMQLEYAEKELSKLKDIESTLFRTLKSAEDVSRQIEKEAKELAEKTLAESKLKAEETISEAEQRTGQIIQDTEDRLKRFKEEFAAEVKIQERDFRAIENFRDNLVVQLASLANNTIETVERFEQKYDKESVLNKMEEIKQHVSEIEIPRKQPAYVPPVKVEIIESDREETEEVLAILDDEKPEPVFEIVDFAEDNTAEISELKPARQEGLLAEAVIETEKGAVAESEKAELLQSTAATSAADAANEALAEMHRTAEKARDESQAINKPKVHESSQPKRGGGGSFFDQI